MKVHPELVQDVSSERERIDYARIEAIATIKNKWLRLGAIVLEILRRSLLRFSFQ